MDDNKKCISGVLILSLSGIVCLIVAFILGLQNNFYFAALSFLSFFMLAIILFQEAARIMKRLEWSKREKDNK